MTPRTKKTAAALSGALVLASGAYALGSQAGDGSALAGQNANASRQAGGYGYGGPRPGFKHGPGGRGPERDLSDAASKLGVTEAKLRAALEKLRGDRKQDLDAAKDKFTAELAKALGISQDKVQSALDKRKGERKGERKIKRDGHRGDIRDAFADQLATKLGVDKAKVRSALDDTHKNGGPPDLSALAGKLGVTEAKLRDALQSLRPRMGRPGPGGPGPGPGPGGPGARRGGKPGGPRIDALAKQLGVSQAKLRDALKGLRDDLKQQRDAARDKFSTDLASELGISKSKVDDVIGSLGHHGRRGP
jgi:Clp amino terminal domain, pathogenicity island component